MKLQYTSEGGPGREKPTRTNDPIKRQEVKGARARSWEAAIRIIRARRSGRRRNGRGSSAIKPSKKSDIHTQGSKSTNKLHTTRTGSQRANGMPWIESGLGDGQVRRTLSIVV